MRSQRVRHDWATDTFTIICEISLDISLLRACSIAQSCLTLCHPMNCSLPGASVHGISQARILEWVVIYSCRGSSQPRDRIHVSCVSCISRQNCFTTKPPGKPVFSQLNLLPDHHSFSLRFHSEIDFYFWISVMLMLWNVSHFFFL